ncbi:hypothetical protein K438DRAFT_1711536 [Mycena galopus ATCC 62051]|nr:hypothetical protein K438DRAFT_1711536 [Mycena galopus ATCC 62051]
MTGNGLSQSDLASRLYMTVIMLSEAAERRRLEEANTFSGDLGAMMRDIKIRVDEGFALTTEQKVCPSIFWTTSVLAESILRSVTHTRHRSRYDSRATFKDQKLHLDLDNVFEVPVREKKLVSMLKRVCSSVRNAFRQDLRDSIDPNDFVSLDKFTFSIANKYKLGGPGNLSDLFTIHAALLVYHSSTSSSNSGALHSTTLSY